MDTLLLIGNDKLGRKLISIVEKKDRRKVQILLNESLSFKRVLKLIKKGSLSISSIIKMAWADFLRKDYKINSYPLIKTNNDLLIAIDKYKPKKILLFRAGLVINKKVINRKIPLWNVHCVKLPEYGGLGQLEKALKAADYNQFATCHVVTETIDKGEIIATKEYCLKSDLSYKSNENLAYDAGIKLIQEILESKI